MTQLALMSERLRGLVGRISPAVIPEALVGIGLAANLLVVAFARHFPYQDAPNHLARYVVIKRVLWGEGNRDYSFRWVPSPYIAVDLIGACLVRLFGPTGAEKVLAAIALTLPIAGMYLLLRATAPGRRGWALIAVLIGFSWFLMAGLLNFVIGVGLVLCCLAWWWPRRDAAGWAAPAIVAGMVFGLFFVHLWAPLYLLVVLGATLMASVPDLIASGSPLYRIAFRLPVVRSILLGTTAFAAAWWWMAASGEGSFTSTPLVFRSLTNKILGSVSAFYVLSLKQAAFTAVGYGTLLLIFLVRHGRRPLRDPFFLAASLSLVLYLAFPLTFGPAIADTDRRWLLLAYYLPFCLVATQARPEWPAILAFALLLSLANTGFIAAGIAGIDRQLDDYDVVLQNIPRGSRLLPLTRPTGNYTRVDVYGQYGFWHLIQNDGRVPGIWSFVNMRDRDHPTYLRHLQHFVPIWQPYSWDGIAPLDWQRIGSDYDYIVLVTDDAQLIAEVRSHARWKLTVGAVSLYNLPLAP